MSRYYRSGTRRTRCKQGCGRLLPSTTYQVHRMRGCNGDTPRNDGPYGRHDDPTPTRHHVVQYESMTDALAVADDADGCKPIGESGVASRETPPSDSWDLRAGYERASALAHDGWTTPRGEVGKVVNAIDGELRDLVIESTRSFMDVAGGEVDVADFLTGEPECMREHEYTEQSASREVVTILVGVSASCAVSSDTILRRGAAVCALVDLVVRAGNTVELWVDETVVGCADPSLSVTAQVRVHRPEDLIDVDAIMFACAHPAMLRRIMFGIQEHMPAWVRTGTGSGYGRPREPAADKLPHAPTITLGTVHSGDFRDTASSIAWVREQLAKLGVLRDD